jgi:hypothetical protein
MIVGAPRSPYKHFDWPEGAAQGNNTVLYELWWPFPVRLSALHVYCDVVNTQGTYLLVLTNRDTTNSMLTGANFDMNGIAADTVTAVGLSATAADLVLPINTRMTIDLTSNNAAFDGSGIYISAFMQET